MTCCRLSHLLLGQLSAAEPSHPRSRPQQSERCQSGRRDWGPPATVHQRCAQLHHFVEPPKHRAGPRHHPPRWRKSAAHDRPTHSPYTAALPRARRPPAVGRSPARPLSPAPPLPAPSCAGLAALPGSPPTAPRTLRRRVAPFRQMSRAPPPSRRSPSTARRSRGRTAPPTPAPAPPPAAGSPTARPTPPRASAAPAAPWPRPRAGPAGRPPRARAPRPAGPAARRGNGQTAASGAWTPPSWWRLRSCSSSSPAAVARIGPALGRPRGARR
mmetsp:Transcript_44405/g.128504  ORF Transcript_44405/g.128504 Transcript_44405/m.128504 type:complete len:271 (-) Transcript_44405:20-832(-)